jgi:F0F1-type ATP synthase assembly protein I
MKRLPTPRRVDPDDSVVQGMEAVFTLVLFLGLGYALDRWLGTTPLFIIAMFLLGGVGVFMRFKYSYIARMDRLEAERLANRNARRRPSHPGPGPREVP